MIINYNVSRISAVIVARWGAHDYAQHVSAQRQNCLFSRYSAAEWHWPR